MTDPKEMALRQVIGDYQDKVARLRADVAELIVELEAIIPLFQTALLCTTPDIARDGMGFVRRARAVLAKHVPAKEQE
ncbi:MAG: hypothetical protein Q7S17_06530 [Xanthobacteraceae bacterium]|nr:hypothetical protein [Xanthobacteraceae bacterium]